MKRGDTNRISMNWVFSLCGKISSAFVRSINNQQPREGIRTGCLSNVHLGLHRVLWHFLTYLVGTEIKLSKKGKNLSEEQYRTGG